MPAKLNAEKLAEDAHSLVAALNVKYPVTLKELTTRGHDEYARKAEFDPEIRKNVLQHRKLLRFWLPKLAQATTGSPRLQARLVKLFLDAHGRPPPFGGLNANGLMRHPQFLSILPPFYRDVGGRKRALALLERFSSHTQQLFGAVDVMSNRRLSDMISDLSSEPITQPLHVLVNTIDPLKSFANELTNATHYGRTFHSWDSPLARPKRR